MSDELSMCPCHSDKPVYLNEECFDCFNLTLAFDKADWDDLINSGDPMSDELITYEPARMICRIHGDLDEAFMLADRNFCIKCLRDKLAELGCGEIEIIRGRRLPTENERAEERRRLEEEIQRRSK